MSPTIVIIFFFLLLSKIFVKCSLKWEGFISGSYGEGTDGRDEEGMVTGVGGSGSHGRVHSQEAETMDAGA